MEVQHNVRVEVSELPEGDPHAEDRVVILPLMLKAAMPVVLASIPSWPAGLHEVRHHQLEHVRRVLLACPT
jgi:hypothetical protein